MRLEVLKSKRKGFTLVELIAVVVILGLILAIAVPKIMDVIDNSRISALINNEEMMIRATMNYIVLNEGVAPTEIGDTIKITLEYLQNNNFITVIKNPYNKNEICDGYILVRSVSKTLLDYAPYLKCGNNYISSTIIIDGLVVDMSLGDYMDSNTYLDRSEFNNHGTNYGSSLTINRFGESNKASNFNGINQYVLIPDRTELRGRKDISVSLWVNSKRCGNATNSWTTNQPIIHKQLDGIYGDWGFSILTNCRLSWYGENSPGNNDYQLISGNNAITLNTWHQLSFVLNWEDKNLTVFIDGEMVASDLNLPEVSSSASTANLVIGRFNYNSNFFEGIISDVRLYNRALTSDEIKHNYNIEKYRSI